MISVRILEKTLVVMDMQPDDIVGFPIASDQELIDAVLAEIEEAIENDWAIVVVEFDGAGETATEISDAIAGYSRAIVVTKSGEDGSREILKGCRKHDFPTEAFRFTGVHTDVCIHFSVKGLERLLPDAIFEIVNEACLTEDWEYDVPVETRDLRNVVVV